ncbi:MAG: hypothetical protein NO076_00110 [Sulfolobales archaeon]|jgi:hypothetical protein|nr:hypothetical protein [Sulfolobales archaeon]
MSLEEALSMLDKFKGRVDKKVLEKVLNDLLDEYYRSKSVKEAVIVVYAENSTIVKENKELFNAVARALEVLSSKLGVPEAISVILSYI